MDTIFTPGTVITSSWLQEVNDHVHRGRNYDGFTVNVNDPQFDVGSDIEKLQAAANASIGKTLIISGTFSCGSTKLVIPAGASVDCTHGVLSWSSHTGGVVLQSNSTIHPEWVGGELIGPSGAAYVTGSVGMFCGGVSNSPAAPTYVKGPKVTSVKIRNWGEYGFFGEYLSGGYFRSSSGVTNCAYGGVCGVSCNDFNTYFNVIDTIGPGSPGGDAYGTFFDRYDNPTELAQPRSYRCNISYNSISNVTATGLNGQAIDTHGGIGFVINGNIITNCQAGVFITSSSISGIQKLAPKNCIVSNNVITSTLKINYGIYIGGAVNSSVVEEYADGCIAVGNTITGHGTADVAVSGAVRLQATAGTVLSGNNISKSACNNILLDENNIGFSITGGSLSDPYDNTYSSPNCILVAGINNAGYIGGINLNYTNSGLGTYVAVGSIRINGGLTGIDLTLGSCPHYGIDASHLQYLPITTSRVDATALVEQSGTSTLSSGLVTITFPKRFPAVPKINVSNISDTNQIRVASVTATSATFSGTGNTSFYWRAFL